MVVNIVEILLLAVLVFQGGAIIGKVFGGGEVKAAHHEQDPELHEEKA
jgi:hypothetical protein